jgi:hypothetical protein
VKTGTSDVRGTSVQATVVGSVPYNETILTAEAATEPTVLTRQVVVHQQPSGAVPYQSQFVYDLTIDVSDSLSEE